MRNRLKGLSKPAPRVSQRELPFYGVKLAFERLCHADSEKFAEALQTVRLEIGAEAQSDQQITKAIFDQMLFPCFNFPLDRALFAEREFDGDDRAAHRAMCVASVLYVLDWEQLTPDAQRWAGALLKCRLPLVLSQKGMFDLLKAKSVVARMIDSLPESPYGDRPLGPSLTDPFIGM